MRQSTLVINGDYIVPPTGIEVRNFVFDNEPHFKHKLRTKPLQHFVIHETAGRSADRCKRTLLSRGYGVHLILDRSGIVSCHGDLAKDVMIHANQLNSTSIGVEIVNPYAPSIAGNKMRYNTIPAQWWTWCPDKNDRRYVLPTDAQLETLKILVPWLCQILGIPYVFPTKDLNTKNRQVKGIGPFRRPKPGVVAHRDFASHSDGRYPLEYLISNS
jgi:hypothetical protein